MMTFEDVSTVRALVREAAAKFGDSPYLRTYDDGVFYDVSFNQFSRNCDAVSTWVTQQTKEKGHQLRIATIGPNSVLYATVILGIMCSGAAVIPLDVQSKKEELCACLKKADADLLILDSSVTVDREAVLESCPTVSAVLPMGLLEEVIRDYDGNADLLEVRPQECAAIIFTSGTTGGEKGVMHSNRSLTDGAMNSIHTERYIKLSFLPMHHCFCLNCDLLLSLTYGATVCIRGGVDKLGENLLIFEPTLVHAVPMVAQSLFNKLLLLAKQEGKTPEEVKSKVFGSRIRYVLTGGAHLPYEVVQNYLSIGVRTGQGYGMTECSPKISTPDLVNYRPDKAHTAGQIVLRCKTRLMDGELQVSSPGVMMGYVNAPELTAQIITEDGWLRTGDIGHVDEEGFLHITGRKKNLIILSNGENVSPEQIEKALMDHRLVEECLVYGEGTTIVAEIYPNSKYAAMHGISDIPAAIGEIVREVNAELPSYKKVMKHLIRLVPLAKTSTNKIARNQRATADMILQAETAAYIKPENELQQKIFDCAAAILNHREFGVDTDLFNAGMDSLGCITLLTSLSEELDLSINLDDLMTARTVLKLEQLYHEKKAAASIDYSPVPEYPLTDVQKYFIYSVRDNTSANVPALFRLDSGVDMVRLQDAIRRLFAVHPILNNRMVMTEEGYVNSRDDNREVYIPMTDLSPEEWEARRDSLIRPFAYGPEEPMYHIALYRVGEEKYLLFDISHIISDGASLSIMLSNLNRLYAGETVEPEKYSFYEYLLEETSPEKASRNAQDMRYFTERLEGLQIDRAILTRRDAQDLKVPQGAVLRGEFSRVIPQEVREFGRKHGISENAFFMTVYHYCISRFSGKKDTVSTSIHNGRTDNRWSRISGCLFITYNFRCTFDFRKPVLRQLKENADQIMQTMRHSANCMHADEMFFQFQGDLLSFPRIAGLPAQQLPIQLDSLPFHLMIYAGESSYRYELRYWENRFDESLLQQFLQVFDAAAHGMLTAVSFDDVYAALPGACFPTDASRQVLDDCGRKQPFGAWGELYEVGVDTGRMARILPDGTMDYLEDCGRTVMQEGVMKRSFLDLYKLEQVLEEYSGVRKAHAYIHVGSRNVPLLAAEVTAEDGVTQLALMKFLKEKRVRNLLPSKITVKKEG